MSNGSAPPEASTVSGDSSGGAAQDEITSADIGSASQTLEMTIIGNFQPVKWRTQGDPGIAASSIEFSLKVLNVPTLSVWAMFMFATLLAFEALILLRS